MIAQHEINFNKFIKKWTIEGSREVFEEFVFFFLRIKYHYQNSIKKMRRNPGDWSIDVICGDFDEYNIIWQCKFFHDKIGQTQKGEIRRSFNKVVDKSNEKRFKIYKWILCIPINFSPPEAKWWEDWKKKMENKHTILIEAITLSKFREKHTEGKYQDLFHTYFREEVRPEPLPNIDGINLSYYQDSTFIRNIRNSDISADVNNLINNFYFGEYFETNITQKNSEYEIHQLNTIYMELFNLWETLHSSIYSNRKDDDGNDLFNRIREYLINNISYFKNRFYNLNLPILIGLILKLSNKNLIFWTKERRIYNNA